MHHTRCSIMQWCCLQIRAFLRCSLNGNVYDLPSMHKAVMSIGGHYAVGDRWGGRVHYSIYQQLRNWSPAPRQTGAGSVSFLTRDTVKYADDIGASCHICAHAHSALKLRFCRLQYMEMTLQKQHAFVSGDSCSMPSCNCGGG